ncbi:MAG TPA: protein kinase [Blastocatellia bacterium]|nr:protein kinase [Blastocatellia bacterium]
MLETGRVLQGRYEVMRPIGEGGMGAVYLARDQRLGNTVALKETFFSDATLLAAFEREARLLAGLRHPALPKVIDHFADDGQFLVMEYIPGDDLHDMLEACDEPPPLADVLQWADQLLDALDYLHAQDPPIIHRDIKPQNLKLTARNQVVLLDFGLAKGKAIEMTWGETTSSIFGYTPSYAPLEQIQGSGTDARSDIYSLAATLYHLLTGQKPVDALTRASAVVNEQTDPLRPVSELNAKISGAVSAIIMQGMALNKSQRLASAAEMRARLRDAARPVAAKTPAAFLRTEINASGGPAALRGASTNLMASAPATSAQTAEPTGSSAARTSNTGLRKAPPARPHAGRLNRPQPMATRQRRAAVAVASGGASNLSRVIAAVIILTAAVALVVFVFTRSVKREEERAGPAIVLKNEPTPASTSPGEPAQTTTEERRGANVSPQPVAASKPSAGAEQRPASDAEPAKEPPTAEAASEVRAEEPARQQGRVPSMQEPEGTKPLPRQVEEEPRREPVRQERPAPQHEGPPPERVFPPPPFPPPGGMPPPGRRRP